MNLGDHKKEISMKNFTLQFLLKILLITMNKGLYTVQRTVCILKKKNHSLAWKKF